jgi:serine/threonine-protein kinase
MAEVQILCPHCRQPNLRTSVNLAKARFCQHCGRDIVLNNDGPRYFITRVIKEGGQGAVYEAIDEQRHIYAVKEMLDRSLDAKERDEAIDRFEAEAKMLQGLRHPRIPRVYADFKDDGRQYLVMDFVRGEDLEDILKRDGKIAEPQALTWAGQICDVLEYLHNRTPPIIFRDMKPSNIMVEPDGNIKLIDFGIAKVFQHAQRGTQIGTPGYAPPEQYQGLATIQSDVYALGATLHHMLTGRDPRDQMPFSFPPVRDLNPAVSERTAAAVDKAVEKFAEDRFASIGEFAAALQPARPQVQPARPAAKPQPQQPAPRRPITQNLPPAAQPAPQQASPAVVSSPRPATQAQPAQQQTPAVVSSPRPAAQAQAAPVTQAPRRRFSFGGCVFGVVALVLVVATLLFAFPNLLAGVTPTLTQPTATAVTLIQQPFAINDVELVVPAGQDVRAAYQNVFLAQAKAQFGDRTVLSPSAPPAFVGEPENLGADPGGGTKYRATMQGYIFVPQQ